MAPRRAPSYARERVVRVVRVLLVIHAHIVVVPMLTLVVALHELPVVRDQPLVDAAQIHGRRLVPWPEVYVHSFPSGRYLNLLGILLPEPSQ